MNEELAIRVRDAILAHPELHDQDYYAHRNSCGTTYCIAGWACALSGEQFDWHGAVGDYVLIDGEPVNPLDRATELLGLTEDQAVRLFLEFDNYVALDLLETLIATGDVP